MLGTAPGVRLPTILTERRLPPLLALPRMAATPSRASSVTLPRQQKTAAMGASDASHPLAIPCLSCLREWSPPHWLRPRQRCVLLSGRLQVHASGDCSTAPFHTAERWTLGTDFCAQLVHGIASNLAGRASPALAALHIIGSRCICPAPTEPQIDRTRIVQEQPAAQARPKVRPAAAGMGLSAHHMAGVLEALYKAAGAYNEAAHVQDKDSARGRPEGVRPQVWGCFSLARIVLC